MARLELMPPRVALAFFLFLIALVQVAGAATPTARSTDSGSIEPVHEALRTKQFPAAAAALRAAPLATDPRAQYLLGTMYLCGVGVAQDEAAARAAFER